MACGPKRPAALKEVMPNRLHGCTCAPAHQKQGCAQLVPSSLRAKASHEGPTALAHIFLP